MVVLNLVHANKPHTVFTEIGQSSPRRVADRSHFGGRQVFVTIVVCL
jgi:hypothetical protein